MEPDAQTEMTIAIQMPQLLDPARLGGMATIMEEVEVLVAEVVEVLPFTFAVTNGNALNGLLARANGKQGLVIL